MNRLFLLLLLAMGLATEFRSPSAQASDNLPAPAIVFNTNGAWSWFEDERAIVDTAAGKIVVSSVANASGAGGAHRNGDVDVAAYDLGSGAVDLFTLQNNFQSDDHDSAALLIRADGRYLALYSKHNSDHFTRYRISTNPGDVTSWGPIQSFDNGAGTTYSNLHQLSGEAGRIYNFSRTVGFDANFLVSDDNGDNWNYGGRLLEGPGRPYVKYASNGVDEIHFINTEQHPRDFNNSVYHAVIRGGEVFDSFGNKIDDLDATGMLPTAGTQVFAGDADNVAWVSDVQLDSASRPYLGFSVQKDGAGLPTRQGGYDFRYYYGRFDGTQWNVHEMAYGGTKLYSGEDDYTGNLSLDPDNPNTVYISTDVNPVTQAQLIGADGQRHYEIFKGTTTNYGANWNWAPVTFNSTVDNLRPILPKWNSDNTALLWMRGKYTTYTNYDLQVVGLVNPSAFAEQRALAVDIGATGQVVQSGFAAFSRSTNPGGGAQAESFTSAYAASGDQIAVTIGGGEVKFRDRGNDVAGPLGRLADDFVFLDDGMTLSFSNLAEGDYHLVLYSHDRNFEQRDFDILLNSASVGRLSPTTGADPLVGIASSRVAFAANGTDDVAFTFQTLGGGDNIVLDGFELLWAGLPSVSSPPVLAPLYDLNGDGSLDLGDFSLLIAGLHSDLSNLSLEEAYRRGDLNGDLAANFSDFVLFRRAFDAHNGEGALNAALTGVPEPSTFVLAAVTAFTWFGGVRCHCFRRHYLPRCAIVSSTF